MLFLLLLNLFRLSSNLKNLNIQIAFIVRQITFFLYRLFSVHSINLPKQLNLL